MRVILKKPKAIVLCGLSSGLLYFAFKKWWNWKKESIPTSNESNRDVPRKNFHRNTVSGLLNVGNSCFMNSLLQSLASSENFVKWLKNFSHEVEEDKNRSYFANQLLKVLKKLSNEKTDNNVDYFDPSELLTDLSARGWHISMDQQDAHEFLQVVMATLGEEYDHHTAGKSKKLQDTDSLLDITLNSEKLYGKNKLTESGTSSINGVSELQQPFKGRMLSQMICESCGRKVPIRCDDFVSLSLPLPQSQYRFGKISLENCMKLFMKPERLEKVECENCLKNITRNKVETNSLIQGEGGKSKVSFDPSNLLNGYTTCTRNINKLINDSEPIENPRTEFVRSHWIGKLPSSLCIHLQRLVWSGGMPMKIHEFVAFPEKLSMSAYHFNNLTRTYKFNHVNTNMRTNHALEKILQNVSNRAVQNMLSKKSKSNGLLGGSSSHQSDGANNSRLSTFPESMYELRSVLVHHGGWSFSGHFVCYRKISGINKSGKHFSRWLHTSDSCVRFATKEEVFSAPAYMLFYERI